MSSSDGSAIHFFKKIDEDTLRKGDLRIPRSFVSKYWQDISNPLHLLLPKGAEWEVKWRKVGADIWLIDKWKKFAEFYSLDEDNLLIFKYVAMSRFEVVVLHQTGLEIMYPLKEATLDNAENGNDNSSLHFKKTESSLPRCRFYKKVKTNRRNPPNISEDVANRSGPSQRIKDELDEQHTNGFHSTKFQKRDHTISKLNERVLLNHFSVCMNPRNLPCLCVGRSFCENNGISNNSEATLEVGEISWNVKIDSRWRFTKGWYDFIRGCKLMDGDLCHFELIDKKNIVFKVTIETCIDLYV